MVAYVRYTFYQTNEWNIYRDYIDKYTNACYIMCYLIDTIYRPSAVIYKLTNK